MPRCEWVVVTVWSDLAEIECLSLRSYYTRSLLRVACAPLGPTTCAVTRDCSTTCGWTTRHWKKSGELIHEAWRGADLTLVGALMSHALPPYPAQSLLTSSPSPLPPHPLTPPHSLLTSSPHPTPLFSITSSQGDTPA